MEEQTDREWTVTFTNCVIEMRRVIAKDEGEAAHKAKDVICKQAAKTSFDVWLDGVWVSGGEAMVEPINPLVEA